MCWFHCYSSSDIFVTNKGPDTEWRTSACGLIEFNKNIQIINCFYSGKIRGFVYTTSKVSGLGAIVGEFASAIANIQLINCHLLHDKDTFAMDVIVENRNPIGEIDLTLYNDKAEMSSLTDKLNKGLDEPIWVKCENGLPQLKFVEIL